MNNAILIILLIVIIALIFIVVPNVPPQRDTNGVISEEELGASPDGAYCTSNATCKSGFCNVDIVSCMTLPGNPCTEGFPVEIDCVGPDHISEGACGHPDNSTESHVICCESGETKYSNCSARYFCTKTLANGAECRLDDQCISGICAGNEGCSMGKCSRS